MVARPYFYAVRDDLHAHGYEFTDRQGKRVKHGFKHTRAHAGAHEHDAFDTDERVVANRAAIESVKTRAVTEE